MKIVIPVHKNRVSPVFDWCSSLLLVDIQSGRREVAVADKDPGKQAYRLVELGADLVVCGGISKLLLGLIEASKIGIISGVSGDIDDVVAAIRTKEISHPRFMMPGCTGHRGQRRLRSGGGSQAMKRGNRR